MPRDERVRGRSRPVEVDIDDDGDADIAVQGLSDDRNDLREILRNVDRSDIIRLLAIILRARA